MTLPGNGTTKRVIAGISVLLFGVFVGQILSNTNRITALEERTRSVIEILNRCAAEIKDNRGEQREEMKDLSKKIDRLVEKINGHMDGPLP